MLKMEWDEVVERKFKSKAFIGGESLVALKEFIANLPDILPDNMTARIELEVLENK